MYSQPQELVIIPPQQQLARPARFFPNRYDTRWVDFFNRAQAMDAFENHIEGLECSDTPERHTQRLYKSGLGYYLSEYGAFLPTEEVVKEYARKLKEKGLKPKTINSKYAIPLRHYIRALVNQAIDYSELTDREFRYVVGCKDQMRAALDVRLAKVTAERGAVNNHGHRLSWAEVNSILNDQDTTTLNGLRDYVILYIGFTVGLRIAEIQRLTQENITLDEGDTYIITVRGKRKNYTPVPADKNVPALVQAWITSYNATLPMSDPRRIKPDEPLWRPLSRYGHHLKGRRILPVSGIRQMINRKSERVLGYPIAPHDMRRTAAKIAYKNGMDIKSIQRLLRHAQASTTDLYMGDKEDLAGCLLTNMPNMSIDLPTL